MSFDHFSRLLSDSVKEFEASGYEDIKEALGTSIRLNWIAKDTNIPKPEDDLTGLMDKLISDLELTMDSVDKLKTIALAAKKWSLLDRIQEFQKLREEFKNVLKEVIPKLEKPDILQKLISQCARYISEDSKKDIKDAGVLFKELENRNCLVLQPKELIDLLDEIGLDKSKEKAVFDKLDNLAAKFKQREEDERRKDEKFFQTKTFKVPFLWTKKAVQVSTGVLCMEIGFKTLGGKLVLGASLWTLYRYNPGLLKECIDKILPLGNKIIACFHGSVCIIIHSEDRASLRALWHQYQDGTLQRKLQDFLVTEDIRRLAGGEEVIVSLYTDPQHFKDALPNLIITESQAGRTEDQEFPGPARVRRYSDSALFVSSKQNEAKLIYAKQEETKFREQQLGAAVKDVEQIKAKTKQSRDLDVEALPLKKTAADAEGCMDLSNNTNKAIPLCLPNNCRWNAATGEYEKTGEMRSSLYVVDEALQKLRTVRGPVCVVSIAGKYRTGKSYVLNKAFDLPDVFPVANSLDPRTMGIWMWIMPQKIRVSSGQECTVVLLDSEGIEAFSANVSDDNQIFTLTVLLSSVLIYNSLGVPTRQDLDGLDFIMKLSHRITLRSSKCEPNMEAGAEDKQFFHKTFPYFIWLLRDVTQSLPSDCRDVKDYFLTKVFKERDSSHHDPGKVVAESILRLFRGFEAFKLPPPSVLDRLANLNRYKSQLNPRFLEGVEQFKRSLRSILTPKYSFSDGEVVTGEGLASLVQLYVKSINSPDVIPNVQSAWETYVMAKYSAATQAALSLYDATMTARLSGQLPCDNGVIRHYHEQALEKGVARLESDTADMSPITTEKYLRELTASFDQRLDHWHLDNKKLTREACTILLKRLKEKHLDPVLAQLRGKGRPKVSFQDIIQGYNKIEQDYKVHANGAKDVCAAVFFDFHPALMEEMQGYVGVLGQLKDFDEKLTREIAARGYQERETVKLREEHARLLQQNRERQMEMEKLQEKFAEERERIREQMATDAKAQKDRMENMVKASMTRAEEDRKAFAQENQALNNRLGKMQRSNEEMQQMIDSLKQQQLQNCVQEQQVREPGFFDKALLTVTGLGAIATALPKCSVM